jgi:hypothetical protein
MKPKRKPPFKLTPIPPFDARMGYRRCELAGVGGGEFHGIKSTSDFWHAPDGRVVVRFSCRQYRLHFAASTRSGKPLTEMSWEFGDYIMKTLLEWISEGVGDVPDSVYRDLYEE